MSRNIKVFVFNIWRDVSRDDARSYVRTRAMNIWPSTEIYESSDPAVTGLDNLALHGVIWRWLQNKHPNPVIDFHIEVFRNEPL